MHQKIFFSVGINFVDAQNFGRLNEPDLFSLSLSKGSFTLAVSTETSQLSGEVSKPGYILNLVLKQLS